MCQTPYFQNLECSFTGGINTLLGYWRMRYMTILTQIIQISSISSMTFLLLFQWSRYGKIQINRPLLMYDALPFLTAFLFSRGLYSVSYFCSHFIVDLSFQCTIFSINIQWQIGILITCSTHCNNKGKKCHLKVICTSLLLWIYFSISYFYPSDTIFLFLWPECIKMISKETVLLLWDLMDCLWVNNWAVDLILLLVLHPRLI